MLQSSRQVVCAALQFVAMHCSHAVFSMGSPPSGFGTSTAIEPPASVRQAASAEPLSVAPSSVVLVSPVSPESPVVTSATVPESSWVVPVLELDEHPTALTLTPAPATIKATTDKANFFI